MPLQWQTVALADFRPHQGFAYIAPRKQPTIRRCLSEAVSFTKTAKRLPFRVRPDGASFRREAADDFTSRMARFTCRPPTTRTRGSTAAPTRWCVRIQLLSRASSLLGLAALALLQCCCCDGARSAGLLANRPFLLIAVCLIGLLAANRAWLFVDYPLVAIHPQTPAITLTLRSNSRGASLPNFSIRPPVYPIFLRASSRSVDRALSSRSAKMALSFVASLLLVDGAYRWKPVLAWPALMAIASSWLASRRCRARHGDAPGARASTRVV